MAKQTIGPAFWVMAVASLGFATQAAAQDNSGVEAEQSSATDADTGLGVIVVTAQRRSENLQDTALAISAFTGDSLEERGINDIAGLQSSVPNLHIGEEQGSSKISLRGIGLQGTSTISDSGVAFYIDNFYVPRPAGGSSVFYDIERVEVLRGPQGTLYGRNATGGVVNVISRRPQNHFEGEVGLTYGSRDLLELRGVLNTPLGDVGAARISAVYSQEDGYIRNENTSPGTRDFFGSPGDLSIRGQLLFGDPDSLEVLLSASHNRLRSTGIAQQFLERNIGGPGPVRPLLAQIPPDNPDPLVTNNNAPSRFDNDITRIGAQLSRSFGTVDAILQIGKQWQNTSLVQDFDGSPLDISNFFKTDDNNAESLEFRLSSNNDSPFSWIVGAYYFSEQTYIRRIVELNGLTPGGPLVFPNFDLDERGNSTTYAGFASGTYSLSDTFRLSAGIRYTHDEKDGEKVTNGNFGAPFPPDIPNAAFPGEVEFDRVTYTAGIEWDVADDVLLYANISNGYKAGGFNITSDGSPYNPESITAYQAGIKSDLFDRRVRLNADLFYYDYTDLQLTTLGTFAGTNTPGQFTTNAASSEIYGIELEAQFAATDNLLLSASYAYIEATFGTFVNSDNRNPGLGQQDLSGNRIPYVSNHTLNLGAQYNIDLGSAGELTTTVNFNYHDELFLREFNDPMIDRVGSNTKTDITITWNVAETGLSIAGYVNNLEDNVERNNIFISPGFIGLSATTAYSRPRTFGVRLDYAF